MLERGEIHLGQMLPYGVPLDDGKFASQPLESAELLAACHPSMMLGSRGTIDVAHLAPYPLLLLDGGYGLRRAFDAACRLAGLRPSIQLESRSPHTLLVLAEAQHGVAIIASTFRAHRYNLKIVRILFRGRPLSDRWQFCGISAVRCLATARTFARCGPSMCVQCFRSSARPKQWAVAHRSKQRADEAIAQKRTTLEVKGLPTDDVVCATEVVQKADRIAAVRRPPFRRVMIAPTATGVRRRGSAPGRVLSKSPG